MNDDGDDEWIIYFLLRRGCGWDWRWGWS